MKERTKFGLMLAVFLACFFLPVEELRGAGALHESLALVRWYAREHVLLCLVPAFFIAGAMSVFLSGEAVMRYLGPSANRMVAYPVAATSGTILAVCSCTVLPLFAGIRQRGAGLGPATAFLYSGPAINVLAIILTAQILGPELGLARAFGAIIFAVVIGLLMSAIFRRDDVDVVAPAAGLESAGGGRAGWQDALFFTAMVGVLVFANWAEPSQGSASVWAAIHDAKWPVTAVFAVVLAVAVWRWFDRDELLDWLDASWDFTKQILPLLLAGVAIAGLLLGGPEGSDRGLVPSRWIEQAVGGNAIWAILFAAVVGVFMYFATLTEVPILQGLLAAGMGPGPALALLLAGPALSLPNMLVIRGVLGTKKTVTYVALVVLLSTAAGAVYSLIV